MNRTFLLSPGPILLGFFLAACNEGISVKSDSPLDPVPLSRVDVTDAFWAPKQEVNRAVSIWHCFRKFSETSDFDSPKLIEAAADMLAKRLDPQLEAHVEAEAEKLAAMIEGRAADPDRAMHVSGHFLEAAAAYAEATGRRRLLEAALKAADSIASAYGPGKKTYISGHEGLKIGLIHLYRATGQENYWKLAKFFLDERGRDDYPRQGEYALDRTYAQDHRPVRAQTEAVGHAVRATFLYIPLTDLAALTGDESYGRAADAIWEDMVTRKTYLTGGIGSIRFHEQFGAAYELPNLSAWNETCAAYGNVVWNHRMFLLRREAKYLDLMERVLYNGFLVGVSLKGDRFFYQNPLISYGNYERFDWINVPCCPPNVVRLMASLGNYIYAAGKDALYVNLFIGSRGRAMVGSSAVRVEQETRYPWDGTVKIRVEPDKPARFAVHVRIPGWATDNPWPGGLYAFRGSNLEAPRLMLNGKPIDPAIEKGFARIERTWSPGDTIELALPMPVRRVLADGRIKDDEGRVALQRGPLVFCAEWPDNGGRALNIVIPDDAELRSEFREGLLGGVQVVTGRVLAVQRAADRASIEARPHDFVAIPYYAWANRGAGEMAVWVARREDKAWLKPVPPEPIAGITAEGGIIKTWTGYNDQNDDLSALYDGVEPLHSADESSLYYRLRPAAGSPARVEYSFKKPTVVSSASVYWVDDRRFCRPPDSWRILYKAGGRWRPVSVRTPYGVEKDTFNTVAFDPVTASAVRLEVEPRKILYRAGEVGPPEALFLDRDIEWRECGIIEWRLGFESNPPPGHQIPLP